MKFDKPLNSNYAGTIVKIENLIPIENADRIVHVNIFGNLVIVDKDTSIGQVGIFFPLESALLTEFLYENNLFRNKILNKDNNKAGFFEENGRIRAVKLRGAKSMGFFIPIESLSFIDGIKFNDFKIGDTFDQLNGKLICQKYVVKKQYTQGTKNNKKNKKKIKKSSLIENQFALHYDTSQLGKNIWMLKPNHIISITQKIHGTSVVISKPLCKKRLSIIEKVLKFIGIKIIDTEYKNIYSSRKVVKNDELCPVSKGYYKADIWGLANDRLKNLLVDGLSIYAEIVGYIPNGGHIQKGYDYGCKENEFEVFIYRITYTNSSGNVFEFSAKQVQNWGKANGIETVSELYYGSAISLFPELKEVSEKDDLKFWQEQFLDKMKEKFLEKDCWNNSDTCIPDEGVVLKIEDHLDVPAFKLKSFRFLERETNQMDNGEIDIEESLSTEE